MIRNKWVKSHKYKKTIYFVGIGKSSGYAKKITKNYTKLKEEELGHPTNNYFTSISGHN